MVAHVYKVLDKLMSLYSGDKLGVLTVNANIHFPSEHNGEARGRVMDTRSKPKL